MRYLRFGAFCIDLEQRTLARDSSPVAVEPKLLTCIELLASRAGALMTHAELQAALWPGVRVGPEALQRLIRQARKALGNARLIQTRARLGYVLAAQVTRDHGEPSARAAQWLAVRRARPRAR